MAGDAGELVLMLWKARRIGGAYQPSGAVVTVPLADVKAVFYAVRRIYEAGERAEDAGELRLDPKA